MEVLEAIRTRRSIRKYKSKPVEEKTLATVLEAARQAPSWANTQCWRFVVVRDGATKSKLSDTLSETNPARDAVCNAPLVIVACAEMGRAGYKSGEVTTDKGDWFMFDVALAMQNLVLAAHSLGLGTVYVGLFDAKKAASILSVPEGYCAVAITPLGYPDEIKEARSRKELDEIVHYDKWGPE
ncbi:MAG: nitroreductase family protein [Dehalococcoidales bacterium]|nr:nitroreductase family protein [Dehalococcoidales bacterium]